MILGHMIELASNNKQATYFNKACGVACLAYNWALAEWQKQYEQDKIYRDGYQKNGIEIDKTKLNNSSQFKLIGKKIKIPNLGWVKFKESLRFNGKILNATIFKKGIKWFVSVGVEIDNLPKLNMKTGKAIGIDLGITDLAVLSNGTKIQAPKPLKNKLKKLQRLS